MQPLNREQILNVRDRAQLRVAVEEWGGEVVITALSVKDRAHILGDWARLAGIQKEGGDVVSAMVQTKVRIVALSITDEAGEQLFTEADIAELSRKSENAIGVIADEAVKLNRFFVRDTEDTAKN